MKKEEAQLSPRPLKFNEAKVRHIKQISKVLAYFYYNVGTSLDCARATGILRNSITYYIVELEVLGLLRPVVRRPDTTTGYLAKHYSADPSLWQATDEPQHGTDEEKGGTL